MKKSIALILFLLFILSFCGCVTRKDHMTGTPMVKVILKQSEQQKDKLFYYIVDNERHAEKTDVFIADSDVTIFYADTYNDFKCEVVSGKVINTLTGTKGIDKNGNTVMADEITTEIMQIAANSIEHDMYEFSIWCTEGKFFVFIKLNVNLQNPCILYSYNKDKKELTELYSWQNKDLVGISTNIE